MDRNQLTGLILISAILGAWFVFFSPKKPTSNTSANVALTQQIDAAPSQEGTNTEKSEGTKKELPQDSIVTISLGGVKYEINLRGGALQQVTLLKEHSLRDSTKNIRYAYSSAWYHIPAINAANNQLFFRVIQSKTNENKHIIELEAQQEKHTLKHIYTFDPQKNIIHWIIKPDDYGYWFANTQNLQCTYQATLFPSEKDASYEQQMARINYSTTEEDDDYSSLGESLQETLDEPLRWIGYKQRFFNSSILSPNLPMQNVSFSGNTTQEVPNNAFANMQTNFNIPIQNTPKEGISFILYIGENTYSKLLDLGYDMETIVDYGSGIFSFVKYINRSLVLPFFEWITSYISNIGWVIALLTICIRLFTSPLVYSSYLSSAKMRALRPELQKLKKKCGDDKQKYAFEQMGLYRKAGVNPLGGCIPALLQIPIFIALYSFFNAHIQLRNAAFLWSDDLSSFDSILSLPFSIPFYGDHVSLFTITATITSFFISLLGMSANTSSPEMANNPAIKYMPYIFPLFMLFIFNSMPAALTWYYTVSNLITLAMQITIHRFIIDHDKIIAKIQENKKKIRKKSSFQQRIETMQSARQQAKK